MGVGLVGVETGLGNGRKRRRRGFRERRKWNEGFSDRIERRILIFGSEIGGFVEPERGENKFRRDLRNVPALDVRLGVQRQDAAIGGEPEVAGF